MEHQTIQTPNFQGKVCVITGGAAGIGRSLTETFATLGARVYYIDKQLHDEPHPETVRERIFPFEGDIAEEEILNRFADWVLEREDQIDILINNACLMLGGVLSGCSYADFLYVQRVGVAAPYWLTQRFKEHFRKGASIVNLSSTRAFQSQADTESYSAAKGGITALTHALAVSLRGIARVNAIAPGWIETQPYHPEQSGETPEYAPADLLQHPSQRIGTPEDIARAAVFLCQPENDFVNGICLTVDGGMTHQMIYHNDCNWKMDV